MFGVLLGLIVFSLLTFGAVLPYSWFLVNLLWLFSITAYLAYRVISRKEVPASLYIPMALGLVLLVVLPAKPALGLVAGLWSFAAASCNVKGTQRFFAILLVVGLLEALLGLTQFFISPGWIFGYINPSFRSSGTLINRNHFAGLLEMFIPIALAGAYTSLRRNDVARSYTCLLAGAFMALALLFSVSRMGIFAFFITTLFVVLLLRLRDSSQRSVTGLGVGLVGLVVVGTLWIGFDVIAARYKELVGEDAIVREGRVVVYRDTIRMIMANPGGLGPGEYQDRFREFQTFRPELLFDHAHNDYLESMAEWGIVVALIFWALILSVLIAAIRTFFGPTSPERRGILLACIGAIFSILLHSLTDFNLQIPSNAMLFFTFVGIAFAQSLGQSRKDSGEDSGLA